MNWYYVADGKQLGPVSDAEFQQLVQSGVIRPDTLVWRDGLAEWKPYQQLTAAPPTGGVVCSQCGGVFGLDQVTQRDTGWVCAPCQQTGAPAGQSPDAVRARDYTVDIGGTISAAWATYKANFGSILGATLISFGLLIVCSMIPFIGFIPQLVLTGPLLGGLFAYLARQVRNEAPPVGDVFRGFKENFLQLFLTHIVTSTITAFCFVPAAIVFIIGFIVTGALRQDQTPNFALLGIWLIPGLALLAVAAVVVTYLTIAWVFALPLVADKRLNFWPALQLSRQVVNKHWWSTYALLLIGGLLSALGILACGIGLIFTLPLSFLVIVHQYNRVLGDLSVPSH